MCCWKAHIDLRIIAVHQSNFDTSNDVHTSTKHDEKRDFRQRVHFCAKK